MVGRHEESIAAAERLLQVAPLDPTNRAFAADRFYEARMYDRAIEVAFSVLAEHPESAQAYLALAGSYGATGALDEAARAYVRYFRLSGFEDAATAIEEGYEEDGLRGAVRRYVTIENPPSRIFPAGFCAALGDRECAFEALEAAYRSNDYMIVVIGVDPGFDPLRGEPRFQDLLRRINYPGAS
jgi:tetratricopeptide (TPR) repeat protein